MSTPLPAPLIGGRSRLARPVLPWDGRRVLLRLLLLLVMSAVTFAALVRVDDVVVGRGSLVSVDERTDVRVSSGGVVAMVLAAEGERVRAGQILLRLEAGAERGRLERRTQQSAALERDLERLRQNIAAVTAAIAGREPGSVSELAAAAAVEDWREARAQLKAQQRWRAGVLPRKRDLIAARSDARRASSAAAEAERRAADNEAERLASLHQRGLLDEQSYSDALTRRDAARSRHLETAASTREEEGAGDLLDAESDDQLAVARDRLEAATDRLRDAAARLRASFERQAAERDALDAEVAAAERALALLVLRAPVAGLVTQAARLVPGDRVEAGYQVFSLSTSALVSATATFANRDSGSLKAGAECNVKLDAFPFQDHGVVRGRLEMVGLEPMVDPQTGESRYPVRIALASMSMLSGGRSVPLSPGLTLSAEVVTGRPRLLSLLFEPVRRLLGGTMRPLAPDGFPSESESPAAADPQVTARTAFDGARALRDLSALTRLGPRPRGSPALEAARRYVRQQLQALGLEVRFEARRVKTASGELELVNLHARLPAAGDDSGVVLLATHLDTRRLLGSPGFVGANEGASGAAVLLECARALLVTPERPAVELAFFDGKEAVGQSGLRDGLHGSRAMVDRLVDEGRTRDYRAVVVCDMVGDRHLRFTDDLRSTPWVADELLAAARRLGYEERFERASDDRIPLPLRSDHVPFLNAGMPAALLCDFDFGGPDPVRRLARNRFWRTAEDDLSNVSADSLQLTGDVLVEFVLRGRAPTDTLAAGGGHGDE